MGNGKRLVKEEKIAILIYKNNIWLGANTSSKNEQGLQKRVFLQLSTGSRP